MFKIVENIDGSTSVFCSESGRLICTVKGKKPAPVAIVKRPLIRNQVRKKRAISVGELTISYNGLPKEDSPQEKKQRIKAWADSINSDNNSYVSTSEASSCEELSDECVDQFSFLQAFDLIGTSQLSSKKLEDLRSTFPLRSISRTRPVLPSLHPVARPYDEIEMCSPLGMKLSQPRHQLSDSAQEQAAKKYDKYCKISVLSLHPNLTLHPALRNREILKYPVTFRPQKGPGRNTSHLYTFSAHQRQRRYRTLVTGLSKRGRYLKRQCKKVCVRLERLTEQEIEFWTKRHKPNDLGEVQSSSYLPDDLRRETLDKFRRKSGDGSPDGCNDRESDDDDDVVMIGEVINNRTSGLQLHGEHSYVKCDPWTANGTSSGSQDSTLVPKWNADMQCVVPLEDVKHHLVSTGGAFVT